MVEVSEVRPLDIRELQIPAAEVGSNAALHASMLQQQPSNVVEFSVPVLASVVVVATGEFDKHAGLITYRPRIVTRWQQHDIVL